MGITLKTSFTNDNILRVDTEYLTPSFVSKEVILKMQGNRLSNQVVIVKTVIIIYGGCEVKKVFIFSWGISKVLNHFRKMVEVSLKTQI